MFTASRPVWAKGRCEEINLFLEFDISLPENAGSVRMTASAAYQLYADGEFMAYGPARAGDGHFRVDEWSVRGRSALRVLVAGYYTSCFQYTLHPSFLNLEVLDAQGNALIATGRDDISCREYAPRLQHTDKYARQRVYTEVYDFTRAGGAPQELEILPDPVYLPRRVAPFSNVVYEADRALKDFDIVWQPMPDGLMVNGRSPFNNNILFLKPHSERFFEQNECLLFEEVHRLGFVNHRPAGEGALRAMTARLYGIDVDRAGLIGLDCNVAQEAEIYIIFDELLTEGDVIPRRANCLDAVKLRLPAGRHRFLTFEPYTLKYVKVCVARGAAEVERIYLLEQAGLETKKAQFDDPQLQRIYDAACNAYRQSSTDIFMDCPSRERAGWLCDSFFSGRVEYALTGQNSVETSFLENFWRHTAYRMPPAPEGIVPMLYPGSTDFCDEGDRYIINWNLWLVIEIAEYALLRGGDPAVTQGLRKTVYGILGALRPLENELGLVEDMPGWVFVEWSRANDRDVVCGVNFPSNMLYSGALEAAGRLYGDDALIERAAALREVIRRESFNGRYFVDNAVRRDGRLVLTDTTTEVCQYYAFFFEVADAQRYPGLWDTLLNRFGPGRKQNNACPDVPFANAFIGNYLRLEVLAKAGCYRRLREELAGYFGFMAEANGALWEYDTPRASCCHGFASHAAVWLLELKRQGEICCAENDKRTESLN